MSTTTAARGDRRRTALLKALDRELRTAPLDSINVADISRRAGVTRSAFYFYFENKASAVSALTEQIYDASYAAADRLRGDGPPAARVEAMVRAMFDVWEEHEHLFRASLEARAASSTVRALWDLDRESFVPVVAAVIEADRTAGRAPGGVDATVLASVLLELNDRIMMRVTLGGPLEREQLVRGVVTVWLHTIYGVVHPQGSV